MAVLSELTELLRRWDVWKRVEAAPSRIDALEKRVLNHAYSALRDKHARAAENWNFA